jgi:signal transduction histidine kinase
MAGPVTTVSMTDHQAPAISLANLPATAEQRRVVFVIAVLLTMGLVGVMAFAAEPMPRIDGFIPALQSVIFINDLITALLLFSQYSIAPSRALLVLACSYLFTALVVVAHLLTFPGAFAPAGLLGAGPQSTAWLYYIWHVAAPVGVLAYASLKDAGDRNKLKQESRSAAWWSAIIVLALVCALTWLVTQQDRFLPAIMAADGVRAYGALWQALGLLVQLTAAAAIAVLWSRRRSVLDYWLLLVVFAVMIELTCTALFGSARFTLGWYAGRIYSLIVSVAVLVLLLKEIDLLYARLAHSTTEIIHRERALREAKQRADLALDELRETQANLIQSEKLASLGQLVAGVAHEINTPVGNALTTATVLSDEVRNFGDMALTGQVPRARLMQFVERMKEGSHLLSSNLTRAADLVNSFKQVTADQVSSERRKIDMATWTHGLLTSLRPAARKTGHEVTVHCQPGLMVDTYPGALAQVLSNLFMNAIVHAYAPGAAGQLRLTITEAKRGSIRITFADDGKGMSPQIQSKVFDPFFTTTRNRGSAGLGLHIVYNLVTRTLKGSIEIASRPGAGTTFTITLPVKAVEHPFEPMAASA